MTRDETRDALRPESVAAANSTIVSIAFDGKNRRAEVGGTGVKHFPRYGTNTTIGYILNGSTKHGLYLTNGSYYKLLSGLPLGLLKESTSSMRKMVGTFVPFIKSFTAETASGTTALPMSSPKFPQMAACQSPKSNLATHLL
jgi:hypothetical protein